ncbi:MT-A70 family methyltransferase [Nitrospirillum amazonense]|uniref:MT-A70 family methyltransferase n=1 Tax=Nitrospirillum amazonense TaxID=28077 RepID=UPI002DD440E3|nr:MT-A70 family methyltransferase [Nitrospirillum amazonense]MEC4591629.1 MT-A70 family methyltransferase [Nitrospirillum amazonense]
MSRHELPQPGVGKNPGSVQAVSLLAAGGAGNATGAAVGTPAPGAPWPFGDLVPLRYSVILADPPWQYRLYSQKGESKAPQAHYDCMDLDAIKALPVSQLAAPDAVCVMWATAPLLPQAIETMRAWGFAYKTAGAWGKQSSTGRSWAFGTGYVYRSAAEFWLVGTIGRPEQRSRSIRNLIVAPVREHSRKPDQMHADIEALWHGPYCELFARQARPGWDSWGNQVGLFQASSREAATHEADSTLMAALEQVNAEERAAHDKDEPEEGGQVDLLSKAGGQNQAHEGAYEHGASQFTRGRLVDDIRPAAAADVDASPGNVGAERASQPVASDDDGADNRGVLQGGPQDGRGRNGAQAGAVLQAGRVA